VALAVVLAAWDVFRASPWYKSRTGAVERVAVKKTVATGARLAAEFLEEVEARGGEVMPMAEEEQEAVAARRVVYERKGRFMKPKKDKRVK
jgi:hypothetical protein